MNNRKHIYYITVGDLQRIAKELVGRNLSATELARVTDTLLDRIQWFDVVEDAIVSGTRPTHQRTL
jgi:hypothetical protein